MSERGVFAIDRGIWEHDVLAGKQPFSRREAWMWLVSEAAWKPHRRRIVGRPIDLKRGQLVASTRFMAGKWKWTEARVRRFLDVLTSEAMIVATTDAGINVITICKYDEYQRVSLPTDATCDATTDAGSTQDRRKVEDKENKEEKKDIGTVAKATRPRLSIEFEEFWKAYPRRDGGNPKHPASKVFASKVRSGFDAEMIIAAARRYASEMRTKGQEGTPYVAQAKTWLNQHRFDDYKPPPTAGPPQAPAGMPSDEQLRAKYARPNQPFPTETQADSAAGSRTDHPGELQRSGAEIRPGFQPFGVSDHSAGNA